MKMLQILLLSPIILPIFLTQIVKASSPSYEVQFEPTLGELLIRINENDIKIATPAEVSHVGQDQDTVYLFKKKSRSAVLLSRYDLEELDDPSSLVPYAEVQFGKDLGTKPILDFAVSPEAGATYLIVAVPDTTTVNRFKTVPYVFTKVPENEEKVESKANQNEQRELGAGLMALTSKGSSILGQGEITLVKDPETKGTVLLSLDRPNNLIHEYDASNPFEIQFRTSHPLPKSIKEEKGKFELENAGAPFANFYYQSSKKRTLLSLARMKAEAAIKRAYFLNQWTNESKGNLWTKQLLAWGSLSSLVDSVDRYFENANFDVEALLQEPEIQTISSLSDAEIFSWAEQSQLFSKEELELMKAEATIQGTKGRKWFIITTILAGALGGRHVLKSQRLKVEELAFVRKLLEWGGKTLEMLGVSSEKVQRLASGFRSGQRKFRGYLINSVEELRHPKHLVTSLEKRINRYERIKAARDGTSSIVQLNGKGKMQSRVDSIMKEWERIFGKEFESTKVTEESTGFFSGLKQKAKDFAWSIYDRFALILPGNAKNKSLARLEGRINKETNKLVVREEKIRLEKESVRIRSAILKVNSQAEKIRTGVVRNEKLSEEALNFIKASDKTLLKAEAEKAVKNLKVIELDHWARYFIEILGVTGDRAKKISVLVQNGNWMAIEGEIKALAKPERYETLQSTVQIFKEISTSGKISEFSMARLLKSRKKIRLEQTPSLTQAYQFTTQIKPARIKEFTETFEQNLRNADTVASVIASWTAKGDVHPAWDYWASVSSLWAKYFLPEKVYQNLPGKLNEGLTRFARQDYVRVNGVNEKVVISGSDARLAIVTGAADVTGDVITQWLARKELSDPNERIWGSGDNFIELVSVDGKDYGIHFDLIASELHNLWGWSIMMPLSYARMGMNHGATKRISHLRRLWDAQVKSLNPINFGWNIANDYPFWLLSNYILLWDYRLDHEKDFDPAAYEAFQKEISDRLTSASSIGERVAVGKFVGVPYINPQYLIQTELNQVITPLTRSAWPATLIGSLVMPVSTGYGFHKWWGDYFGFNHPATVELMKTLQMEGILKKIDKDGYTDLTAWTEQERKSFFMFFSLMEMARFEKENPLPVGDAEALAAWYAQVFQNMVGENLEDVDKADLKHIKIAPSQTEKNKNLKARYSAEADDLLEMMKSMRSGIARLPFEPIGQNDGFLAVQVNPRSEGAHPLADLVSLERALTDIGYLQSALADTVRVMRENRDSHRSLVDHYGYLALVDAVILGNLFFGKSILQGTRNLSGPLGRLVGSLSESPSRWAQLSQKLLGRSASVGIIGSIPAYFWLDDQMKAHLQNQVHNGEVLNEMQELLLNTTEALAVVYQVASTNTAFEAASKNDFKKIVAQNLNALKEIRAELEYYLTETQAESNALLTHRRYRWAKVYSEFGPVGIGMFGGWILGRHFLYKSTGGFVLKMADSFAPFFLKASVLSWLVGSQYNETIKGRIHFTTQDFFDLYQAYISTLVQMEILESLAEGIPYERLDIESLMGSNQLLHEMQTHRENLIKLVSE